MTHIRKPIQIVVAPSNEGSDQFVALADDGTMWLREGYWTKECPDGGVIDGYTVPPSHWTQIPALPNAEESL